MGFVVRLWSRMFRMIGQFDDHLEIAGSLISAKSEQGHILLDLRARILLQATSQGRLP